MAEESLQEATTRLQQAFLGRYGIHGMGCDSESGVIHAYTHNDPQIDMSEILTLIRQQSQYPVKLVYIAPLVLM